ncbi:hypothetical protein CRG98_028093, partial [Punica granatum]
MEFLRFNGSMPTALPFVDTPRSSPASRTQLHLPSPSTSRPWLTASCRGRAGEDAPLSASSAYDILGIEPGCSAAELKAAFRAK